ncbi:MAG: hypothetical protein IPH97_06005 [Ignavibacteriales bacterium]|nr:hypothetical protein [Ignavibacteriales bacterium]
MEYNQFHFIRWFFVWNNGWFFTDADGKIIGEQILINGDFNYVDNYNFIKGGFNLKT